MRYIAIDEERVVRLEARVAELERRLAWHENPRLGPRPETPDDEEFARANRIRKLVEDAVSAPLRIFDGTPNDTKQE